MRFNILSKYILYIDFNISLKKAKERTGICSQVYNTDKHILLWDFDNIDILSIKNELRRIQYKYELSDIYISKSSENHYHAYCLTSNTFKKVIQILVETNYIDDRYLMLGIARHYYTLRISPKKDNNITLYSILKSEEFADVTFDDVTMNNYLTTNIK